MTFSKVAHSGSARTLSAVVACAFALVACHRDGSREEDAPTGAARPMPAQHEPAELSTSSSVVIQNGRTAILRVAGASLEVPAGAVDDGSELTLIVSSADDSDYPTLQPGYEVASDIFTVSCSPEMKSKREQVPMLLRIDSPMGFTVLGGRARSTSHPYDPPEWFIASVQPDGDRWQLELYHMGAPFSVALEGRRN